MVPLPPLDSPQTLLWTRLPSVARLKARGPQGRLVLQGYTIDRSGAFRSVSPPPCTVWPRTVMRGKSRKGNSGHNSVPKSARRPELCSRNSRFAAHLRCVSAKEGKGSQEGTGNHVWCPVPFCPCRWVPTPPGCRRRPMCTLTSSVKPPPAASRLQRRAAGSAEGLPSADGKKRKGFLLFLEQKTKAEGKTSAFLCNNYLTKHRKTWYNNLLLKIEGHFACLMIC